jgi:hypothetical protein
MTDNVKLMFEVEDLRNASPATVSRAGIIFVADSDLDWLSLVDAWLSEYLSVHAVFIRKLFTDVFTGVGLPGSEAAERQNGKRAPGLRSAMLFTCVTRLAMHARSLCRCCCAV